MSHFIYLILGKDEKELQKLDAYTVSLFPPQLLWVDNKKCKVYRVLKRIESIKYKTYIKV